MPVGNAMPYLRESVASILGQTHRDFEFVIVDDGTTDGSGDYVREQAARDSRIRVDRFESNRGLIRAGNRAVELARAPLVARMDADDISAPERLERQLEVMARNPDAVVVGAMSDGIDRHGRPVRGRDRWRLLRRSMFPPLLPRLDDAPPRRLRGSGGLRRARWLARRRADPEDDRSGARARAARDALPLPLPLGLGHARALG